MRAAAALLGRADHDEPVRARGGEHPDGVRARGARGVQFGGGARCDLGDEQGRAGADGCGDKHDPQRNARSYVIGPESHSSSQMEKRYGNEPPDEPSPITIQPSDVR
ncbi:hypothetical protein GCM10009837_84080 [Streptomyces durmitorensis]